MAARLRTTRPAASDHTGSHYTREEVVASIDAGDAWVTGGGRRSAVIYTTRSCPHHGCRAEPYLKANPDSPDKDNLENLDEV